MANINLDTRSLEHVSISIDASFQNLVPLLLPSVDGFYTPKYENMSDQFTHLDTEGNPSMVDVGKKGITRREAVAQSIVVLGDDIMDRLEGKELQTKKGPVFQTAILAGIMAAKKTSELIPLCHPLALEKIGVDIQINDAREVVIECKAILTGKTGVEMEALTGATVAALTIYDMCKAFSHDIVIKQTQLLAKSGGKRDFSRNKE